jgi:leucyl/phenylalanyl-tRNA--protein transferase
MPNKSPSLPWLAPGQEFPPVSQIWNKNSQVPGLLAAGGALNVETLCRAYSKGIFPWFSEGLPILWWSPDPRMVLDVSEFRIHPSFRKTLQKFSKTVGCEIRIDSVFEKVIHACATSPREGQAGTWIVPDMINAYCDMHRAGIAHSVETWVNGQLVGGLYCIALGKSVFGESMFSVSSNASKIALAALVCFCRRNGIRQIDCQQNTRHMSSLGAREIPQLLFVKQVAVGLDQVAPAWEFTPSLWSELFHSKSMRT